jgi:hypothetical protein
MRSSSAIKTLSFFAAFAANMALATPSRADDPYSQDLSWSGIYGLSAGNWTAECPASGQYGYCTPWDHVEYYSNSFSLDSPHVILNPTNLSSWVVSSGEYAWCSVAITCHLGGGAQSYYYDEKTDGSKCDLNPCDGPADEIWVAVGVSHFPP